MKAILQLQQDAMNNDLSVSQLLRKLIVISTKLDLKEINQWAKNEMYGYKDTDRIPAYRKIKGQCKYFNDVLHGWCTVIFANSQQEEYLTTRNVHDSVAKIEELLKDAKNGFEISYPPELQNKFANVMYGMVPTLLIEKSQLAEILDFVRNKILDFTLELEKQRILGDEMMFSDDEKMKAKMVNATFNITGNPIIQNGNYNTANVNSVLNDDRIIQRIKALEERLNEAIKKVGQNEEWIQELSTDLQTIKVQLQSPNPKSNIIKSTLISIKNIVEGTAGNILAGYMGNIDIVGTINNILQQLEK